MSNPLQFWLSFNNGAERLRLPVNPEMISISATHGYEDVEVTQLGEYTVIGNARLKDFSFSSFFPRDYNPSYCEYESIPKPWEAVDLIEKWKESGRPMRLTVTGTPINEAVTIRSFNIEVERAGSVGDIYFDISFKQYVFVEFKKYKVTSTETVTASASVETLRPDTSDKASSYTVVSGDSLFKIAAKASVYGSGDKWRKIYDANKSVIGANPNLIKPGQTLVIP